MEEKHWVDYVSALGSIATPVLVLLLTAVGWKYKKSVERKIELEEKLRANRIEIYNAILEPFIILLMTDAAWKSDKRNKGKDKNLLAMNQMLSLEYRKVAFKLSLIANDAVVKSYNNLMQYFYNHANSSEAPDNERLREMMSLLGGFLLEIRRSMGNETTELDNWSMLEWFMTDAKKLRDGTLA